MVKKTDTRCPWCRDDPLYVEYHDQEWGRPVAEQGVLFERLVLEGMQAGLSWLTVLRKRAHMRERFFGFEPTRLARAGERDIERWLADPGIIRHRGKLEAMIANARATLELEDGLPALLWSYVDGAPVQNRWRRLAEVPAQTDASRAMAKGLKRAGFRFVGPTTCYALMQSAGLVNDHLVGCTARAHCEKAGREWKL